jgi:hypothetical protein
MTLWYRRSVRFPWWIFLGFVANVMCLAKTSFASGESPLQLDYREEMSCPDRAAFLELLQGRTPKSNMAGAAGARATVRLSRDASGFVGRLDLERPDGTTYQRDVGGTTCSEVANALSFVLALALGAKDPGQAEPTAAAPPAAASAPVPPAAAPLAVRAVPSSEPSPRSKSLWRLGVGTQFGVRSGLAPNWTTLEAGFVEARRLSATPFTLSLRGSIERAQTVTTVVSDFSWTAGQLEACPARLRVFDPVTLVPCVAGHAGVLRAVGHPADGQGRTQSKVWLDGLADLRLEARLLRGLSLQLQGELIVPFTAYDFRFDGSGAAVYKVANIAAASLLGLAAQFP